MTQYVKDTHGHIYIYNEQYAERIGKGLEYIDFDTSQVVKEKPEKAAKKETKKPDAAVVTKITESVFSQYNDEPELAGIKDFDNAGKAATVSAALYLVVVSIYFTSSSPINSYLIVGLQLCGKTGKLGWQYSST